MKHLKIIYNNNKLSNIDFKIKKYQRYYFNISFKKNNNIVIPTIIDNFKKITNIPIKLTNIEKAKIKHNII